MNKDAGILVIGAGSIGERHIGNLLNMGYQNIHVFRQRNLPFRNISNSAIIVHTNWSSIPKENILFAIICTPTNQHLEQTLMCLEAGFHVLVEKPLSHSNEHLEQLIAAVNKYDKLVQVAYMMRFHPHMVQIKNMIENNQYGKLHTIRTHWGSYLPDWHPYEDYKTSYAANKNMGGGVALTLSHDLDLVNWLADSQIQTVAKKFGFSSNLNIDVESVADFQISYQNDITAQVHLNYLEQIPQRRYTFIFEDATVEAEYFSASITIHHKGIKHVDTIPEFDRNDLFKSELSHFISNINNKNVTAISQQYIEESAVIINLCQNE